MRSVKIVMGVLLVAGILAIPAGAFTINTLAVTITESGDAEISVDYSLSWVERVVVFMRIAHPDQQLEQALERYARKEVTVTSVNPGRTELYVEEFVRVTDAPDGGIIYTTPSMDFSLAEQQVKGYWFSRFVTVDSSPEIAVITFPDGYQEQFVNVTYVPSVIHQTTGM